MTKTETACCSAPDLDYRAMDYGTGRDCEKRAQKYCKNCGCETPWQKAHGFNATIMDSAKRSADFHWQESVMEHKKAA